MDEWPTYVQVAVVGLVLGVVVPRAEALDVDDAGVDFHVERAAAEDGDSNRPKPDKQHCQYIPAGWQESGEFPDTLVFLPVGRWTCDHGK